MIASDAYEYNTTEAHMAAVTVPMPLDRPIVSRDEIEYMRCKRYCAERYSGRSTKRGIYLGVVRLRPQDGSPKATAGNLARPQENV
ncbi:hypothetical protein IAQ61_004456 [Plenodomus lingam]|uniref:Predicted protein n=1 Tax=Leptosphaeria maculans (strain JN3 / isolate v23.1.3 / race Av1-4-5-6-7-8) TaxID=985895 RepID=E4ZVK5_LEPMJ|nr:predicted protein [Plenodomus lingam JN3]KAH9873829.1 hypothetical protein IAQ61_004456 [Plenodomus lingam]CBX95631.1 predicted protein [Plenodomus lingam JN3]